MHRVDVSLKLVELAVISERERGNDDAGKEARPLCFDSTNMSRLIGAKETSNSAVINAS
jgi:hypothetical protein